MAYRFSGPQSLGIVGATSGSAPAFTSTYTAVPSGMVVGQEVEGIDDANGYWGKFKLLYGAASTTAGDLVYYDHSTGLTTRVPASTKNLGFSIAVALVANTSTTTLAWYQTQGVATVKKSAVTVSPNVAVYVNSGTAGRVKVLSSAGAQVLGMRSANTATVTSTTSTVLVTMANPCLEGA